MRHPGAPGVYRCEGWKRWDALRVAGHRCIETPRTGEMFRGKAQRTVRGVRPSILRGRGGILTSHGPGHLERRPDGWVATNTFRRVFLPGGDFLPVCDPLSNLLLPAIFPGLKVLFREIIGIEKKQERDKGYEPAYHKHMEGGCVCEKLYHRTSSFHGNYHAAHPLPVKFYPSRKMPE